jgi:hypothetical protein
MPVCLLGCKGYLDRASGAAGSGPALASSKHKEGSCSPYYPFWPLTVIALDILVIWALAAHGRDVAADRY